MDVGSLTVFSLISSVMYIVTACCALAVVAGPRRTGLPHDARRHWFIVIAAFASLTAWRLGQGEIRLQEQVRAWTRLHGLYDERHDSQAWFTILALAAVMAGIWASFRNGMPGRSKSAMIAALGLLALAAVRLVSLHAIDSLLYRTGPFHLNYVFDMGLTVTAAGLALLELRAQSVTST